MRLAGQLDPDRLTGQVILLPALNAPAFAASARVSPLDGGEPEPGVSGRCEWRTNRDDRRFRRTGSAWGAATVRLIFIPAARRPSSCPAPLATQSADPGLRKANLALAQAFGLPLIWELGGA